MSFPLFCCNDMHPTIFNDSRRKLGTTYTRIKHKGKGLFVNIGIIPKGRNKSLFFFSRKGNAVFLLVMSELNF